MIWDYAGLGRALLPEAALIAGALAVLGLDLTVWRRSRQERRAGAASGTGAVAVIAAFALAAWVGRAGPVLGGAFLLDALAVAERLGVLGLTLLVLGIGTGAERARQPAETVAIMLLAAVGFTLMGAAQNLLVAFLALELASLSLYILVGLEPARPDAAEAAVKKLTASGFEMKNLSVVGKGYHTEEKVMGFYSTGDRIKFWGTRGAFWGGLWGLFFGGLFMTIPVVGHVVVLGYLAATLLSGAETAIVVGGLSALGAALYSVDIPKDSVINYEAAVKADKFLVLARGTAEEMARAHDILKTSNPSTVEYHGGAKVLADA